MLEQVLRAMNNWFVREIHTGEFTVADGRLALPFLQEGQYFRVVGSVFNDGLHQYPAEGMTDEAFAGAVWALSIPKAVISLSEKATEWDKKYGEAASGPYQSESFGGYSYTRGVGSSGTPNTSSWKDAFASELNRWRKL